MCIDVVLGKAVGQGRALAKKYSKCFYQSSRLLFLIMALKKNAKGRENNRSFSCVCVLLLMNELSLKTFVR